MTPAVTAILIGYGGPAEDLTRAVDSLLAQSLPPAQVVCVDQSPDGRFDARLAQTHPDVVRLRLTENIGYSSACNLAVPLATGDYLFFVNPDAHAEHDCLEVLVQVLQDRPEAAIAGAQILLPDGRVNAGDNSLHISGLAWAGHYGEPREQGPPRPAAVASGAALLVRREAFEALGGYTEGFFMYHDDVDIAWRARLHGWEVLFCPQAAVVHEYEFSKGDYKWQYMERNRWWCLLAHLEARTLIALAPLLLAVELAVWLKARREGWTAAKAAGWRLLWADRRPLRRRRAELQRRRVLGDRAILERMTAEVESPFIASGLTRRMSPFLRGYRRLLLWLTGL